VDEQMTRTGVGLRVERSDAPYAMLELELQAHASGPPLYALNSLEERFYILQGKVTFRVGDAAFVALPGAGFAVEAGIPRSYANDRDEPARVLLVCTHASRGSASDTSSEVFHQGLLLGAPFVA
jgi:quercetin dioxygenase-like cupin family protein